MSKTQKQITLVGWCSFLISELNLLVSIIRVIFCLILIGETERGSNINMKYFIEVILDWNWQRSIMTQQYLAWVDFRAHSTHVDLGPILWRPKFVESFSKKYFMGHS